VLFHGLGAYSIATNTRFNGFGAATLPADAADRGCGRGTGVRRVEVR
jgi:hypothetical protein